MQSFALIMAVVGVIVFCFSFAINAKSVDYDLENEEKEAFEGDKDEDFKIMLKNVQYAMRVICAFVILISICLYLYLGGLF